MVDVRDVRVRKLELVAEGFSFPTSLTFDQAGIAYIAESGLPFGGATAGGRVWRVESDGQRKLLASSLRQPVNGLTFHRNALYISEGGHPGRSGRISRLDLDGRVTVLLDRLPGPGNYHTNMVAFGPDGKLYFSQGATTNTGIVGLDAYELGWLRRLPHAHDIPGCDVVLTGVTIETPNPLSGNPQSRARTSAFAPFGTATEPMQYIPAQLPCTAAIMRCNLDGSELELVAWGVRNAYGIGFLPDGRLLAVDQGADDRGSRPVGNVPDMLFEVRHGAWYGWPDFIGGEPITSERFLPQRGPRPTFILANHDELPLPEKPLLRFPSHAAAVKFDVAPPILKEQALYIAFFGDEVPMTASQGPRVGRSVVRVDLNDWSMQTIVEAPLARPIDVRFHPLDHALYILDFGQFEIHAEHGVVAIPRSGGLWRLPLS